METHTSKQNTHTHVACTNDNKNHKNTNIMVGDMFCVLLCLDGVCFTHAEQSVSSLTREDSRIKRYWTQQNQQHRQEQFGKEP